MTAQDGNGWVECRCGDRHWGRHGAAGLVLVRWGVRGARVLMQLRAEWTHQGGCWALPGGALDSHEDPVIGALREAREETGLVHGELVVTGVVLGTDHGDWSYTYVLATADDSVDATAHNDESDAVCWVDLDAVADLDLHPAMAGAWPRVREAVLASAPTVGAVLLEDTGGAAGGRHGRTAVTGPDTGPVPGAVR